MRIECVIGLGGGSQVSYYRGDNGECVEESTSFHSARALLDTPTLFVYVGQWDRRYAQVYLSTEKLKKTLDGDRRNTVDAFIGMYPADEAWEIARSHLQMMGANLAQE